MENFHHTSEKPTKNSIENMLEKGLIEKIVGPIPENPLSCIITWARNPPKKVFIEMVKLAKEVNSGVSPKIYVDDMCSLLDTECSESEQEEKNQLYRDFFEKIGCNVVFSSDLYPKKDTVSMFLEFKSKIDLSINDFLKFLPKSIRDSSEIPTKSYYHMIFELLLMDKASESNNCILAGSFSEMMIHAHREKSKKPMTGLLIPKLS